MEINTDKLIIFITSPLEATHVEHIRLVAPDRTQVIYEPDLLPPTRYIADHKGVEGFQRSDAQEQQWRQSLAQANILWDFPLTSGGHADGLSFAPNVRWVQTTSSGVGQLIKGLGLQDSDILVTTARGVHAGPLAEFVFMALLVHYRNLNHLRDEKDHRHWARYCGDGLEGKTLAVIGAGRVGRRVIEMGRAFGMHTIFLGRAGGTATVDDIGADQMYPPNEIHALLARSDAVVLSTPHTPETENLIDDAAIAAMKRGSVLVNVARGAVVDEPALVAALETGHIGLAALDVFAVEPLPGDSRLWDLPNVLISPHSASTVARENELITDIFCRNLERYLQGRFDDMENVLDKVRMY